jgi:hypothetical protein
MAEQVKASAMAEQVALQTRASLLAWHRSWTNA